MQTLQMWKGVALFLLLGSSWSQFRDAVEALKARRPEAVRQQLETLDEALFPLPGALLILRALAAMEEGNWEEARAALSRVSGFFRTASLLLRADLEFRRGDPLAALRLLQQMPPDRLPEDQMWLLLRIGEKLLQEDAARALLEGPWERAYQVDRYSSEGRLLFDRVARLIYQAYRHAPPETQEALRRKVYALLRSAGIPDYQAALLKDFPASAWVLKERALLHKRRGYYSLALRTLDRALNLASEDEAPEIHSERARILAALRKPKEALQALKKYATKAPAEAAFRRADYLATLGQRKQAREEMRQLIAQYPASPFATRARFWLFQDALRQKKTDEALEYALEIQDPAYQPFQAYWKWRLTGKCDDCAAVVAQFPGNWYTVLLEHAGFVPAPSKDAPERQAWEVGARLLLEAGLWRWVRWYLADVPASPRKTWYLALAHARGGDLARALRLLVPLLQRGEIKAFSETERRLLLRTAYPMPFQEEVREVARRYQIPEFLLYAIIRRESFFDPGAVSPARAVGLMQLLPSTARWVAKKVRLPFQEELLFTPKTNLLLGTAYFHDLLNRFGAVHLALLSYNWGARRVRALLEETPKTDVPYFLELVPNAQPRLYAKRILADYWMYAKIWRGKPPDDWNALLGLGAAKTEGGGGGASSGTGGSSAPAETQT